MKWFEIPRANFDDSGNRSIQVHATAIRQQQIAEDQVNLLALRQKALGIIDRNHRRHIARSRKHASELT